MKAAVAVVVVFAMGVFLVSVTSADGPQVKVLGGGKAGAAGRLVSLEPTVKLAPVPDVPPALRASIVGGLPKSASPGQSFSLSSSALRAPAQNGLTPSLNLLRPELVSNTAAFMLDNSSSVFAVKNIPPGSWFVDCTLGEVDAVAFSVLVGDDGVPTTVNTIAPIGGHIVLGLLVKTRGQLQLWRTKSWATTGCKFEAN